MSRVARALMPALILLLWANSVAGQDDADPTSSALPARVTVTAAPAGGFQSAAMIRSALGEGYLPAPVVPVGPSEYPDGVNPLSGLPYPNEEARSRRNLIVKISNWPPQVRPQQGLNQADLVFEYEAEGGVTRFAALYRSNAPRIVGSIRSARLLDMELLTMYAALLAYSGTSGPLHEIYKNASFRSALLSPSLNDNCATAGFCRDDSLGDRSYEHTLFGDTQMMWQRASQRNVNIGYRAVGLTFGFETGANGRVARDIYMNWFNRTDVRWQYDGISERYLRYSDGIAHLDAADDAQLWADNLVFLQASHYRRPDLFRAGAIDESYEVALWGQGPAYVLRDGLLFAGFWRRPQTHRGQALQLVFADGDHIQLKPGRSWITIMRNLDTVVTSELRADPKVTLTSISNAQG